LNDILILEFDGVSTSVQDLVYRHILAYVSGHLERADTVAFNGHAELLSLLGGHSFSTVVATRDIPCETALLLKGAGLVLVVLGCRDDLISVADIVIDPLIVKSEKYLVGMRFLLPSVLDVVDGREVAALLGMTVDDLREEVDYNHAGDEIIEICQLYRKLTWDSDFFGVNVGFISCFRLTSNIEHHIGKFIRQEKIDLVEYLCNCHDRESVLISERSGYSFVDIRLSFERHLQGPVAVDLRPGLTVRKAQSEDVPELKRIGTDIYQYSRYYFDTNFDRAKVIEFYQGWITKAVDGRFDDFAYVLCENDRPIGFCTVKKFGRRSARFNLVGLDNACAGSGLAQAMIGQSLELLRQEGITHAEVVTQGRNYGAQRMYQRCGFVTKSTELWYHKWLC
jgi:dTDP-4-amino-4,6-dideoxy-D-galactose acyltransferase